MSPLSSRAFSVIAKDMLGADSALVVDIKSGPTKSRQGKFAFGDALRLPLQSGSIHHIVTNQLLHALKDGQAVQPSFRRNAWRFFQEVERVLAPGGQIWMKEAGEKSGKFLEEQGKGAAYTQELLQENMKLAKFMRAAFVRLSMTAVHTESIIGPYGNDYLHDPERQIIPNATHGAVALYARKPPATTRRFVAAAAS
jgi:SAM-dependent methyltransferase